MSQKGKVGVLLANLGTPDSTKVSDVRKYLRQFLMDGRVIDIPYIARFALVNFIIAPFRSPKSAHEYQKLWTDRGSPLLFHGQDVTAQLRGLLDPERYQVELGMRYQNPSIRSALEAMKHSSLQKIIVVPMFPQYASATTGSVHQEVMEIVGKWQLIPKVVLVDSYPELPQMIEVFAEQGRKYMDEEAFDHVLFSYHGLPERQLKKADPECRCDAQCCATFNDRNHLCYRAQCYQTSRRLAEALGLSESQYTVCFQSRLGRDPWIQPYTEDMVRSLPKRGAKRVLVFSPAFVADCLETTVEIGEAYAELFVELGGERLQLVESLNSHPRWVEALHDLVREHDGAAVPQT
jgi:ferrochelatase